MKPHGSMLCGFLVVPVMSYRYLFGPVPSRRLGRSLGIDLLAGRQCSFDCVFCEVGPTDELTLQRAEWVPTAAVIRELHTWLAGGGEADTITLAGSGEPTLHTGFGAVIDAVHAACAIPVALLTNSSLLPDEQVRSAAARADIVKVSLSVWDDASMAALNRPAPGLTFAALIGGLRTFRAQYHGRLWVETLLVRGINDAPGQVARIAALAAGLNPERVQLNTVVRPPAVPDTCAVPVQELARLAALFSPPAEVIGPYAGGDVIRIPEAAAEARAMLARRPCTAEDLAAALGLTVAAALALARTLVEDGAARCTVTEGRVYYSI